MNLHQYIEVEGRNNVGKLEVVAQGNAVAALTVVLVVTMFLSDVMNNAATAAVMAPIALGIAATLGVNADGFLMAVAIGASSKRAVPACGPDTRITETPARPAPEDSAKIVSAESLEGT